jgi:hypothetical protein
MKRNRLSASNLAACVAVLCLAGGLCFSADEPLTLEQIADALAAGVSEEVLRMQIDASGCDCRARGVRGAMALQRLRNAGASEEFVRLLLSLGREPAPMHREGIPSSQVPGPTAGTIFGGFSYGRSGSEFDPFKNLVGWNAGFSVAVTEWLSLAGDAAGHYKETGALGIDFADVKIHTVAVGPQFSTWGRTRRTRGFGRVMVGAAWVREEFFEIPTYSDTGVAVIVGGGLDVGAARGLAFRAFQSDWVYIPQSGGESINLWRISVGIVGRY